MKQTILVVDDTVENIQLLEGVLSDNYNIKAAVNGKLALKLAEKFKPDLILLDIMMPEMDGYEVCTKLKENELTSDIPVIFVTAMSEDQDEAKGFEVGGIDYITKPISPVVVKARVSTHLALNNQQRELDLKVKQKTKELAQRSIDLIERLSIAAEYKDNETGLHVTRMSKYCSIIAKSYGLCDKKAEMIEAAAPMHDVGKIGIRESVLQKPGKLDEDEFNHIKEHCEIGSNILGAHPNDEMLSLASIVALEHHEKWNGKGYPKGLVGEQINLYARIVAIADVFDALTSERPYKKAWETQKAIDLITSERGNHFDPKLVDAFNACIDQIIDIKDKYSN